MSSFKDLRVVDNFYQTSLFFPMPTVLISTLTQDGRTTVGPYSLVQPYYVAGKDYYAMLLNARNSSNTAQNLLKNGKCAINFVTDDRKTFKEVVRLGWPGDTPEEKMKDCIFTFEKGIAEGDDRPMVVTEAFQVIECTWVRELDGADKDLPGQLDGYDPPYHDFNGITSKFGATFILKIDKILMKEKYYNAILNGVRAKDFPRVPVDYGYRDSKNFWYARFRRALPELLPVRATTVDSVRYAADRIDEKIRFTDEACAKLVNVPRIFLPTVLKGCVAWARENNVELITAEHMDEINDKRAKEKKAKHENPKSPDREKGLKNEISFDPQTQYAVIRSSICTGEKVAGFKNKKDGHFTEVMVIRSSDDEKRFKEMYGLDNVRTEY